MSRPRMHAIEYNIMMTLLKLLTDRIPNLCKEYNVCKELHIEPSYPRDITSMFKPSIIVRRVDTEQKKLGMGNVLGQVLDQNIIKDVSGLFHQIMVQFDMVANSNTQAMMISSILTEDLFNDIIINECGHFQLYDFTGGEDNPTEMGIVTISDTPSIASHSYSSFNHESLKGNLNNDYTSVARVEFTIVQEILPKQEYVDLAKWIKIHQQIQIKEV